MNDAYDNGHSYRHYVRGIIQETMTTLRKEITVAAENVKETA